MTGPGRRFGVEFTLLILSTALVADLIRTVGPLLDRAFAQGVVPVASTALGTFAAPAVVLAVFLARRHVTGTAVLVSTGVLALVRLTGQGLGEAIGAGSDLGLIRYGVGLAAVPLGLAHLALVVVLVARTDTTAAPTASGTWTPGLRIALGTGGGLMLAAGANVALSTWDAFWRLGVWGWLPTLALVCPLVACAWQLRATQAIPRAPRGLWLIGPFLLLGIQMTANPAFLATQTGLALPHAVAALIVSTLAVFLLVPQIAGLTARWVPLACAVSAVALMGIGMFAPAHTAEPAAAAWALLVGWTLLPPLTALALAAAIDRPTVPASWLRLSAAGLALGLMFILPLLVFQVDYDIRLPFANDWVPVATVAILVFPGTWSALRSPPVPRTPDITAGTSPAARSAGAVPQRAIRVLAGTTAALLVTGVAATHVSYPARTSIDARPGALRVLDWNLHYGVTSTPSVDLAEVADVIVDSGADVVLLQEISRGWILGGSADMGTYLARATGMRMVFVPAADRQFGNAILWDPRRGDLADVRRIELPYGSGPQRRSAISATIDAGGVPVRLTSLHLQHREENTPTRIDQLDALFAAEPVSGPYLLAGDFNAEPGWPEIDLITGHGLTSAQDTVGDPTQATSPSTDPIYRIDWAFGSDQVEFTRAEVVDSIVSDHRPLLVELQATR